MPRMKTQPFIEDALVSNTDGCILWPHALRNGYGCFRRDGHTYYVHSTICERVHGPRPPGHEAAHTCGVHACVNPRHIRWATPTENQADRVAHGTTNRGERCGASKLTEADVRVIRRSKGRLHRELAVEYGVVRQTIDRVIARITWAHLED